MGFFFNSSPEVKESPTHEILHTELVGRSHSTKSTLVDQTIEVLLQRVLDSGLSFRMSNPRRVATLLRNLHREGKRIHRAPRLSTTTTQKLNWLLCEGTEIKACLKLRDSSGQVLTNGNPKGSYLEDLAQEYQAALPRADVIWQFLPCLPKDHTHEDTQRFRYDAALTSSYIHESLDRRPAGRPVAVAVVVPRIDTRYDSAKEARERFARELKKPIHELLRALTSRREITEVALFPITALGFGTTIPMSRRNPDADPFANADFGERDWLLKEEAAPKPFNVLPLLVWTVLAGLRQRVVSESIHVAEAVRLCRTLATDLDALNGLVYWLKDD